LHLNDDILSDRCRSVPLVANDSAVEARATRRLSPRPNPRYPLRDYRTRFCNEVQQILAIESHLGCRSPNDAVALTTINQKRNLGEVLCCWFCSVFPGTARCLPTV
jgi:hypothetical protein